MVEIRRLNMDNSWQIRWNNHTIVLDPWLSGDEIDGFKAFNQQWHNTTPLPYEELGKVDALIVSQPYSDHCHEETLSKMDKQVQWFAVPPAIKRLRKTTSQPIGEIPSFPQSITHEGFYFSRITPKRLLDPIYHAIVIHHQGNYIFYAPHGFFLSEEMAAQLKPLRCVALITTFTHFTLPFFLGGLINPGVENAMQLIQQLQPLQVLNTHDENKKSSGMVSKLARVTYPDFSTITLPSPAQALWLDHYRWVELNEA